MDLINAKGSSKFSSIKRLNEIKRLTYDWNGYGAGPFSKSLIRKCKKIIFGLVVQPEIFPSGRDSILFEYEFNNEIHLEFEVQERRTICAIIFRPDYESAKEFDIYYPNNPEKERKEIARIVNEQWLNQFTNTKKGDSK